MSISAWMYTLLAVWIIVSVYKFAERYHIKKNHPHRWARRQEGLVSISDKQMRWLIVLWPLATFAALLFLVLVAILYVIEMTRDGLKRT